VPVSDQAVCHKCRTYPCKHCEFLPTTDELWKKMCSALPDVDVEGLLFKISQTGERKFDLLHDNIIVLKPTGPSGWTKTEPQDLLGSPTMLHKSVGGDGVRIIGKRVGTNAFGVQMILLQEIYDHRSYTVRLSELLKGTPEPRKSGFFQGRPCQHPAGFKKKNPQNQATTTN